MQSALSDHAAGRLAEFLNKNQGIDWRAVSFRDISQIDRLDWANDERAELLPLLKAYQRLLYILPPSEDARALRLLQVGLHSAIQIAGLPQTDFAQRWNELFPGEEALGCAVQDAARNRRSELLPQYIQDIQRNEPHYRSARFR
jgi:hypothetical protein